MISVLTVYGVSNAEPGQKQNTNAKAIINKLESLRIKISKKLSRAVVAVKEANFRLEGEVNGSLQGQVKGYSPLSMAVLGGAVGAVGGNALDGLPQLVGAHEGSGGAAAVGALGAVVGATKPTLKGEISGSTRGEVRGSGEYFYDSAKVFGFAIMDKAIIENFKTIRSQSLNTKFSKCTEDYYDSLERISRTNKILTYAEAQELVDDLVQYKKEIENLRVAKKDSYENLSEIQKITIFFNDYESWIAPIRINITDLTAYAPVINFKKTIYESKKLALYHKVSQLCKEWLVCEAIDPGPSVFFNAVIPKAYVKFFRPGNTSDKEFQAELDSFDRGIMSEFADGKSLRVSDFKITKQEAEAVIALYRDGQVLTYKEESGLELSGQPVIHASCEKSGKFLADTTSSHEFFASQPENVKIEHLVIDK